jgi:hypothetical protein
MKKPGSPFPEADIKDWVKQLPPREYREQIIAAGYRAVGEKCVLCGEKGGGFDLFHYPPDFARRIGQEPGGAMLVFLCRTCMHRPGIDALVEEHLLRRIANIGRRQRHHADIE